MYDDSPIADYLEGDAAPYHDATPEPSPPTSPQYAPRSLPRLREQLRSISRTARSVSTGDSDRFLERFRYRIVASQLLSEDSDPRVHASATADDLSAPVSLRGAASATVLSFATAWLLHWVHERARSTTVATWTEIAFDIIFVVILLAVLLYAAQKQYLRFTRQAAAASCSRLLSSTQEFDRAAARAIRFIQEIEVVARGYEISTPLPPVSRLDGGYAELQCRELRRLIAKALSTGITHFIHFHNELQPWVNLDDLRTYYNIYELSPDDFTGAVNFTNDMTNAAQETLQQLRFLFHLHAVARKFFLIDLLALRTKAGWTDVQQWRTVGRIVSSMIDDVSTATTQLQQSLNEDAVDSGRPSTSGNDAVKSPSQESFNSEKQQAQAHLRRFETVANGARTLNAKIRIGRDDITDIISNDAGERVVQATIARHYEALGSEIRTLLTEWERGRPTMLLSIESGDRETRPVSDFRSPLSPSPSLGGLTLVDGGPADALKTLIGEDAGQATSDLVDEEVFEAVVAPRKPMSLGLNMSREEKMLKLREDRRKRATLQEQTDNTTNMLRELQMVIKHRPPKRQDTRVSSV